MTPNGGKSKYTDSNHVHLQEPTCNLHTLLNSHEHETNYPVVHAGDKFIELLLCQVWFYLIYYLFEFVCII